ncbi:MAG: EAL domain-containing protein [Lachnospiraceae bacterium]|nr:EAL domain-containing protein [Lachnospiraceae bacterium]
MEQFTYSPIGDVLTIIITCILLTQITAGHTKRNSGYAYFLQMILFTIIAAVTSLIYYIVLAAYGDRMPVGYYLLNVVHYIGLFTILALNVLYLARLVSLQGTPMKVIRIASHSGLIIFSILEFASNYLSFIVPALMVLHGKLISVFAFVLFISLILWILIAKRSRIVRLVYTRLIITYLFCLLVLGVQGRHGQTSFTTAIYLLPILQLIHFLHPTPFDAESGAFDESAFKNMITTSYRKQEKLFFACLHLYDYEDIRNFPDEMRFEIYHFYSDLVKRGELFQLQQGRMILVFKEKYNRNPEAVLQRIVDSFQKLYAQYHADFRVILMESVDSLSEKNHYVRFINFLEERISKNDFHRVTEQDIQDFTRWQYILKQLDDIATKQDLDDPRVLVYCQPVYNVTTKIYDTAEALMRVKLPETGLLFPDQFITLAENHGYIHAMSLILLNKTCQAIRELMAQDKVIKRVSVNFSIEQLRLDSFCEDVVRVIRANDVPFEKIAVELTESQNETDFEMVRDKIRQLKEYGITFYLDDFGTGYSNMERIMELPFDIIKFDRSMVIESAQNKNSEFMVNTFADMFRKLDYDVLYEGVEDESDEIRCIRMLAGYLQGYKYSRPIEIAKLVNFLSSQAETTA